MNLSRTLAVFVVLAAAAGVYLFAGSDKGPSDGPGAPATIAPPKITGTLALDVDPSAVDPFPIDGRAHITAAVLAPSSPARGQAARITIIMQNPTTERATGCRARYRIARKADGGVASAAALKVDFASSFALAPGEERELETSISKRALRRAGGYELLIAAGCKGGAAASVMKFFTAR